MDPSRVLFAVAFLLPWDLVEFKFNFSETD